MDVQIGQNARQLLTGRQWFVDKTLFIKEFVKSSPANLILRPRRFGKSVNLEMLKLFLSKTDARRELFENYKIHQDQEFLDLHFGKYHVIYLDFKSLAQCTSWERMELKIWDILKDEASRHELPPTFRFDLNDENPPKLMDRFLKKLIDALYEVDNEEVYVLIDEYDAPLNNAFAREFFDESSAFFGNFYCDAIKGNDRVRQACLMGVLEVHGLGVLSALNSVIVHDVTTEKFSQYFGFTPDEIDPFSTELLSKAELISWYDGYNFGGAQILNPWSVLLAFYRQRCLCYWNRSGSVDTIFDRFFIESAEVVETVLRDFVDPDYGHKIEEPSPMIDYKPGNITSESIWSFLICAGYLTYEPNLENKGYGFAKIPNQEIRKFWQVYMRNFFSKYVNKGELYDGLKAKNIEKIAKSISELVHSLSTFNIKSENSYHNFLFGVLMVLLSNEHGVELLSDIEAGHGRPDVVIKSADLSLKIIFEFKMSQSKPALREDAQRAHQQIIDKAYYTPLASGWSAMAIGVSFHKKNISPIYYNHLHCVQGSIEIEETNVYYYPGQNNAAIRHVTIPRHSARRSRSHRYLHGRRYP